MDTIGLDTMKEIGDYLYSETGDMRMLPPPILKEMVYAGKKTILDTCNVASKPVLDSHTHFKVLKDHPRNIDEDSIKSIVDTGGVMGIT